VITTVPSADRQKATVRVRIGFDATRSASELDPRILPDMGVKVSFLNERTAQAGDTPPKPRILLPKAAVRSSDGASIVFVVRESRAERRAVKVGPNEGDQVEIVSGVNAGDRIVVEGPPTLADGARVKER
jgi:HlyD family secretion protein